MTTGTVSSNFRIKGRKLADRALRTSITGYSVINDNGMSMCDSPQTNKAKLLPMRKNSVGMALGKYVGAGRNVPHALDEILGKSKEPIIDRVVDPDEMENLIGGGSTIFTCEAITTARQHKRGISMSGFRQNAEAQQGDCEASGVNQKDG